MQLGSLPMPAAATACAAAAVAAPVAVVASAAAAAVAYTVAWAVPVAVAISAAAAAAAAAAADNVRDPYYAVRLAEASDDDLLQTSAAALAVLHVKLQHTSDMLLSAQHHELCY